MRIRRRDIPGAAAALLVVVGAILVIQAARAVAPPILPPATPTIPASATDCPNPPGDNSAWSSAPHWPLRSSGRLAPAGGFPPILTACPSPTAVTAQLPPPPPTPVPAGTNR